ncbi:MAG: hypothetical protein RMN51_03385 [Verrucomicrobiota bacterium]|nr:hypothetical protein [Limisphaera sp.]MDW8381142.1 hypothetical protein [Verrucomicrobiota bacterium]
MKSSAAAVKNGLWRYVAAALIALGAVVLTVVATRRLVSPPPLNAQRAAERYKALEEVRASSQLMLTTAAWLNRDQGVVRLPIELAMEIVEREWRDPAQGRSNLMERVRRAYAAPPAPPVQPSPYE